MEGAHLTVPFLVRCSQLEQVLRSVTRDAGLAYLRQEFVASYALCKALCQLR